MLVISTQNWSILAKFAKKIHQNRLFFTDCFLAKFPPKFPVKSADFSKNLPQKSFEIWLFSAEIQQNQPIFEQILTFFPRKPREIGQFFREFAPENPAKFCFFFREISEALKNYMNTYKHGKTCLDKIALAVVRNITKSRPPAYFTRWKRTSQQLKIALENKAMGSSGMYRLSQLE